MEDVFIWSYLVKIAWFLSSTVHMSAEVCNLEAINWHRREEVANIAWSFFLHNVWILWFCWQWNLPCPCFLPQSWKYFDSFLFQRRIMQVSFLLLSIYWNFNILEVSVNNNKYYLLRFDIMVIRVFKRLAARTLQPGSEDALCQVIAICWTSHFQEMKNLVPLLV